LPNETVLETAVETLPFDVLTYPSISYGRQLVIVAVHSTDGG
jgi:hypothetical protein